MTRVRRWLDSLGLGAYAEAFERNDFDWDLVPELDNEMLRELGVGSVGHRARILKAARQVVSSAAAAPADAGETFAGAPGAAERRQLTVLFADLVGSTALSQSLDPEDLRQITLRYQDAVRACVERFGGFVARYMGDGVLAYFGYPRAHEDDAERALLAARDIVIAVPRADAALELSVRVGIATGPVVVGDLIGEGSSRESPVVGETPNLAARLQGIAEPGQVLVSEQTHRLAGAAFECSSLGPVSLEGLAEPVNVYSVQAQRVVASRFEHLRTRGLTPLVGRDEEMTLLAARWRDVRSGAGRVVLVSGEPGIGKSRLIATLGEQVRAQGHDALMFQCSPHHRNTALHPVFQAISRRAGIHPADTGGETVRKLRVVLGATVDEGAAADLAAVASMVDPGSVRASPDPRQRRERAFASLRGFLHRRAREEGALLCLFEDVHWADPSTVELLDQLIEASESEPVLLVLTFRPSFAAPWAGRAGVLTLTMTRMGRDQSAEVVRGVAGEATALGNELIQKLVSRGDGIPLFLEELTRSLLDAGASGVESASALSVPASLRDSLVARLDALSLGKTVAQCGAVLGREFDLPLLEALRALPGDELERGLEELVDSGLVYSRGEDRGFTFKHALVQDAAYETLLRERRAELHRRAAAALAGRGTVAPELLAHHLTAAGDTGAALQAWREAGLTALDKSAYRENVAHCRAGLDLLARLPDGSDRDTRELELLATLCPGLMSTDGYAAATVEEVCRRALPLARQRPQSGDVVHVLAMSALFHMVRAEYAKAIDLARELLRLGEAQGRDLAVCTALARLGTCEYFRGAFQDAAGLLQSSDVPDTTWERWGVGGNEPDLESLCYSSLVDWSRGYPERSGAKMQQGIDVARSRRTAFSHAYMLSGATWLHQRRGEPELTETLAEELVELSVRHGFRHREAQGRMLLGWARCRLSGGRRSLSEHESALGDFLATHARVHYSYFLWLLAESHLAVGGHADAVRALETARAHADACDERVWQSEIHRLRGDIALSQGEGEREAVAHYERALAVARAQGARTHELRAATPLARLLLARGHTERAHGLLAPVVDGLPEGHESLELREALAVLDDL